MTPEFLYYFRSLLAALGDRPGRYALWAARNPDAARAYAAGHEVVPWPLVRTMLRDLAVAGGAPDAPAGEIARAQALHEAAAAAAAAHRPPAPAGERRRPEPGPAGEGVPQPRREPVAGPPPAAEPGSAVRRPRGARFAGAPVESAPQVAEQAVRAAAPRGARFAGAPTKPAGKGPRLDVEAAQSVAQTAPAPRGARFAGAPRRAARPAVPAGDPRWDAEARAEVAALWRLRRAGDSGGAYLALSAAAGGPAERIPYVVRELERTGLTADVATLLWEIAALPPQSVAQAVAALVADGRDAQARTLLHQAASRAAAEVADVADLLATAGRAAEAGELLETVARARTADAAAAVARARPGLTQLLLAAAARVSAPCHRNLAAALARA
ncbi:flagellar biosynthesis protein FlhF [Actinacidiphila epipremni]|uniref:Uncharacterized protein n=1 Tax=Actinacidiphila epipremni TaxID=2053013 RepID=A0ABX0ZNK8_9ACTN|nr:hypothetical protein [Actinacidiphila epipremni]NJP45498.1 hypothetical protein [Actinacidiphila epipremni]